MRKTIIGVMGPGNPPTEIDLHRAYRLGQLIAQEGWVLLTGGRKVGVMDAASKGAQVAGGLTVGILPDDNTSEISEAVDIAIITNMDSARNNINVLSSDVVIACGMGTGTASEVALALKNGKQVVLLTDDQDSQRFFTNLSPEQVFLVNSPEAAIKLVKELRIGNRESGIGN
ncbi:MAG: TIGR00725 family protein [Symploca sp. SIO1A3]|nr:TIGR00725 family protein [Symploca sp. SIO1A3]